MIALNVYDLNFLIKRTTAELDYLMLINKIKKLS